MAFVRAYYHALLKILASLGQPKIPVNPLWQLNMLEYMQMREVTRLLTPVPKLHRPRHQIPTYMFTRQRMQKGLQLSIRISLASSSDRRATYTFGIWGRDTTEPDPHRAYSVAEPIFPQLSLRGAEALLLLHNLPLVPERGRFEGKGAKNREDLA